MKMATLAQLMSSQRDLYNTLASIKGLIGNVDHTKGNSANASKLRGQILNDIRSIAIATLGRMPE